MTRVEVVLELDLPDGLVARYRERDEAGDWDSYADGELLEAIDQLVARHLRRVLADDDGSLVGQWPAWRLQLD